MNTFGRGWSLSTWRPAAYAEDSELSSSRWEYMFSTLEERKSSHYKAWFCFVFQISVGTLLTHTGRTSQKIFLSFPTSKGNIANALLIQLMSCYICGTIFESEMGSYYCTTQKT